MSDFEFNKNDASDFRKKLCNVSDFELKKNYKESDFDLKISQRVRF